MKKFSIYLLICISCLFVITGCNDTNELEWEDSNTEVESIKIICFGNSFTQDCMGYVPCILNDVTPQLDITIGIAYIGGCPLVQLGDGGFLMADTGHLHEGIGCLAAAYSIVLKILELAGLEDEVSIIGNGIRPTKEWYKEKGIPGTNYGAKTNDVVGITDENCYKAQMAAIMAVKYPYEVTDCNEYYVEP